MQVLNHTPEERTFKRTAHAKEDDTKENVFISLWCHCFNHLKLLFLNCPGFCFGLSLQLPRSTQGPNPSRTTGEETGPHQTLGLYLSSGHQWVLPLRLASLEQLTVHNRLVHTCICETQGRIRFNSHFFRSHVVEQSLCREYQTALRNTPVATQFSHKATCTSASVALNP